MPQPIAREALLASAAERLVWEPGPRVAFDFSLGPPLPDGRFLRAVRSVSHAVIDRASARDLDYGHVAGLPSLRGALAARLALHRGLSCEADEIVVTNGASQAFDLLVRAYVRPGDRVAVEDPGYRPVRAAVTAASAHAVPIPVDDEGLDVESLARQERVPSLVYVTPGHQFPTGVTMSPSRRAALAKFAMRTGALVVEDDYDGELQERGARRPAFAGEHPEAPTVYVGSLSKVLGPFLRIGYLRAPRPIARIVAMEKAIADGGTASLAQHIAAELLLHPEFTRWTRRAVEISNARRIVAEAAIASTRGRLGLRSRAPHHLVVEIPALDANLESTLVREALAEGVRVRGLRSFRSRVGGPACVVLGCGRIADAAIAPGVAKISAIAKRLG